VGDERATIQEQAAKAQQLLRSKKYRTDPFTGKVDPESKEPVTFATPGSWIPASFTPLGTFKATLAILAALALMLLLERLASRSSYDLHGVALWGGIAAVAVGFFAIANFHSKVTKVMGFRESVHAAGAFGPFINENNGIGFVNVGFCLLYYLIWRRIREHSHRSNKTGLVFLAVSLGIFHMAVLTIRGSGAGWWIALLFPFVIFLRILKRWPRLALAVALIAVIFSSAFLVFAIHYRFTDIHGRLGVWKNAVNQEHFLIGNGIHSFRYRFPEVITEMPLQNPKSWWYPENEYIQSYFEAGAPALIGTLLLFGIIAVMGFKTIMKNESSFLLVPGLWAEALHAGTDYNFNIWPVVAIYLILFIVLSSHQQLINNHRERKDLSLKNPEDAINDQIKKETGLAEMWN